jgi:hypothetical protein
LTRKGPAQAVNLKEIRLFLYFSDSTFTQRSSRWNAQAEVSKSRIGDSRSDLSCRDGAYRILDIYAKSSGLVAIKESEFQEGIGLKIRRCKIPLPAKAGSPLSQNL